MTKQLIYDLPTRIFHWTMAALFVAAFFIAKTVDDDNPIFSYHMLAGLLLGAMVCLRLLWGVIGTKHARFSSFALHPRDLVSYFKGLFRGDNYRWSGHNPASSWAALCMLGSAFILALTGILMTSGQKETFEDGHELFANAFLLTVLLHISGVLLHAFRHQDGMALAMIHGQKETPDSEAKISDAKPMVAAVLVAFALSFSVYLLKNFNPVTQKLEIFGKTLTLGESDK